MYEESMEMKPMPSEPEGMSQRKKIILSTVISHYVSVAEPVSSETISQSVDLGIKSATVRNELAELIELGLLEQPHTSAGRVPTDKGYRYFVDFVVPHAPGLPDVPKKEGPSIEGEALQIMLRETAHWLSRRTQLLTVGVAFQSSDVQVRNVVVSALGPQQAMLVLIFGNGHVENKLIECPPNLTLQDIGLVNERLNIDLPGTPLSNLSRYRLAESDHVALNKFMSTLHAAIRAVGKELLRSKLVFEGEEFILMQPEFRSRPDDVASFLELLQDSELIAETVIGGDDGARTVSIGKENRDERMHKISVVRKSFSVGQAKAGALAVFGPTRMEYQGSMATVDYVSASLTHALTRFFA